MLKSFRDLLKVHEGLDELFSGHQEALLSFDLETALELLVSFRKNIDKHIEFEEKHLLPLYRTKGGNAVEGGKVSFYLLEHRKIRQLLTKAEREVGRWIGSKKRPSGREILNLIDGEYMFKHLMKHHDLRERNILYRFLDDTTNSAERARILRKAPAPGAPES